MASELNETTWETCTDPRKMLTTLGGRLTARRLQLYVAACCRDLYWDTLRQGSERLLILRWEQYAEGLLQRAEFQRLCAGMNPRQQAPSLVAPHASDWILYLSLFICAGRNGMAAHAVAALYPWELLDRPCHLLRELAGNPFRPPHLASSCRVWRDGMIPRLAQQMYEAREFAEMPILADALEDAGCADEHVLRHCRAPGGHLRGCWVLDQVLGKN